jgi:hypothetical protein
MVQLDRRAAPPVMAIPHDTPPPKRSDERAGPSGARRLRLPRRPRDQRLTDRDGPEIRMNLWAFLGGIEVNEAPPSPPTSSTVTP